MAGYYLVALIAVFAVVASTGAEVSANQIYNFLRNAQNLEACPNTEGIIRLPHPTKCSMYLICQNGKMSPHECGGGLHFNPVIKQCDWPKGCISKEVGVETQPNVPKKDEENKSTTAETTQCVGTCPISDPKDKTILLPTNNDCTKYCACSNGIGIIMSCIPGLHFDKKNQTCNYPKAAKCQLE